MRVSLFSTTSGCTEPTRPAGMFSQPCTMARSSPSRNRQPLGATTSGRLWEVGGQIAGDQGNRWEVDLWVLTRRRRLASSRSCSPTSIEPSSRPAPRRRGAVLYPYELPLPATLTDPSIALTYTLAVRAIRKGNAAPGKPRISYVSASHVRALQSATNFVLWFLFPYWVDTAR